MAKLSYSLLQPYEQKIMQQRRQVLPLRFDRAIAQGSQDEQYTKKVRRCPSMTADGVPSYKDDPHAGQILVE
jgi:hypothetical protein